ncbi:MAG: hypothetical protein JST05_07230 [Acidobacteria bacterium]|nr:hypothetical protein [Acidobacteriota bacterium]
MLASTVAHASVTISVAPTSVTLAPGGTQTFTSTVAGSTNTKVTWSVSSGGGSITSAGLYTAPATTGTYTVTATSQADTTKKATATITVANVHVSVSPSSATLTVGATKTFTATVTGTTNTGVTWTAPSGGSVTTGGVFTSPSVAGTYSVRATSKALTSASGQATITVVAQPVATITAPANVTTGVGGWVASVPVQSGATYAWTITHGSVTSGAGTNAIVFSASTGTTLTLSCKVTNAAGTAVTGSKTVSIVAMPAITEFDASPSAIPPGGTTQITAAFTGGSGLIDQNVGSVVNGTPVNASPASSTTYTLTVTNSAGTSVNATTTITVAPLPDATLTVPASATANHLGFQASVPNQAGCSYYWTITNGTLVTGIYGQQETSSYGGSSIGFRATTAGTPAVVSCTVSNQVGSVQSSASIPVIAAPDATITGASLVQSNATGVTASVPSIPGSTYLWTVQGGTLTSSTTASSITYTAPSTGAVQMTCQVTNAAGTVTAGTLSVSIINQAIDLTGVYIPTNAGNNSNPSGLYSAEVALSQVGNQVTGYIIGMSPSSASIPSPSLMAPRSLEGKRLAPMGAPAVEPVATPAISWTYYLLSGTISNGRLQCEIRQAGSLLGTMTGSLSSDGLTLSLGSTSANESAFIRLPGQPAVILPQSEVVLARGAQFQFNPTVIGATNPSLVWEIQNAPGESITSNGLYTAPAATGIYAVTARLAADPGRFASVMVQVTPDGTLSVGSFTTLGCLSQSGSILEADSSSYSAGPVHYFGTLVGSRWTGTWQQGASSGTFDAGMAADSSYASGFQPAPFFRLYSFPGSENYALVPPYFQVGASSDPSVFTPYAVNSHDWIPVSWSATSGDVVSAQGTGPSEGIYLPSQKPGISFVVAQGVSEPTAVMAIPYIQFVPRSYSPLLGVFATDAGELDVFAPSSMDYQGTQAITGLIVWRGSPFGDLSTGLYSMGDPTNPYAFQGSAQISGGQTISLEVDFSPDWSSFSGTWQETGQPAQAWSGTRQVGAARVRISAPYATLINTGAIVPLTATVAGGADRDVIWSCSGGTVSKYGFFTAPNVAGTYTVTATSVVDGTQSDSITFTVVDHLLHQSLIATYGGGNTALFQDGATVWVTGTNALIPPPPEVTSYTLEGHSLVTRELTSVGTLAPDNSSFNGMSRDAQPADAVMLESAYYTTSPGQSIALKVLATGTPTFSAVYGTVSSQGVYTAPAFPIRDKVTAKQGTAYSVTTIDVMDATQLDPNGVFQDKLVAPGMQLSVSSGSGIGQLQGLIPSTWWGTQVSLSGTLQGYQWLGTWSTSGDSIRSGTFEAKYSPTGDVLDLWLSSGAGPLGEHFTFNRPAQVEVSPGISTIQTQATEAFTAKVLGQVNQSVTWSLNSGNAGSITTTGVFTAGTVPGTYSITASASGVIPGTATVQVYTPYPLIMKPASLTIRPQSSASLQALSSNAYVPFPVTWSVVEPGGGTVTAGGVYTAPSSPGTYHVVATSATDSSETAVATVAVSSSAPIQITITPGSINLSKSGMTTFSAQVTGAANQGITWSCTGGSIDPSTGAYTAPSVFGTYLVQATSVEDGSFYADATVTVQPQSGTNLALIYDANGNMTSDGISTYAWDAENRLVSVVDGQTGQVTHFTYDGLGRRVEITEQQPGQPAPSSDTKYLWDGQAMAEALTADGTGVLQQYYQQGFVDTDGTALYYTRDHQGSVRELTDSSQTIRARYDYDPYGRATKLAGDKDSPFLFTGHFWHGQSGLYLAMFREYDPNLGRWISRDPAGSVDGSNEYAYVQNRVVNATDPTGLWTLLNPLSWMDGDHYQGLGTEFFTYNDLVAACGSTLDGLNPFGNPFSDLYDPCDLKYKISKTIASVSSNLIIFAAGGILGEARALRMGYVTAVRGIPSVAESMLAEGADLESAAKWAYDERNALKLLTREASGSGGEKLVDIYNYIRGVENESFEALVARKGFEGVIAGAGRTDPFVNTLLGIR